MNVICADMRTVQRPQVVHAVTSATECVLPTLVSEAISIVTSNSTASSSNSMDNFKTRQEDKTIQRMAK